MRSTVSDFIKGLSALFLLAVVSTGEVTTGSLAIRFFSWLAAERFFRPCDTVRLQETAEDTWGISGGSSEGLL